MNEQVINEFSELGCKDKAQVAAAAQVYLELCEVKRYYNVKYEYNQSLDIICLTGKKTKSQPLCLFVVVPTRKRLTFYEMQSFLKLNGDSRYQSVYIALVHPDTTCIYYEIHEGLVAANKAEEKKCINIDASVKKHRHLIENAAMCGFPVTISALGSKEASNTSKEEI